ncbi:MAG: hypothetical protein H7A35_02425 [Planctomycetales bacterium]|nr:hypothetical protein [bacterium]UNM08914.1 MAG: hypothetical protein H7A35_02425 [Planctomycetales bacterium]
MSGTVIDPRTGEERRVVPYGLRVGILLVIMAVAGGLLYVKVFSSEGYTTLRDTAYMHTAFLKYAEEGYFESHGRYGTLEELKDFGLVSYPIVDGKAQVEEGISAECELPMDRMDYRITVRFLRGKYSTDAADTRRFLDVERPR